MLRVESCWPTTPCTQTGGEKGMLVMLKRNLVGLGGTEYTVSAINQAAALAMANDAEVTGVSIIDEGRLTYSGPVPIGGGY